MIEVLFIYMIVNGQYIQHEHPVTDHGYLNKSYCLDYARKVRERWASRNGVTIIEIGCREEYRI